MKVTDGKVTLDLSQPHKAIDGKWYQEKPEIKTITEKDNPEVWALLQPKE